MERYSLKRPPSSEKGGMSLLPLLSINTEDLHMRLFHFEVCKVMAAIAV